MLKISRSDGVVISIITLVIIISAVTIYITSHSIQKYDEYPLDLAEIIETAFSNTVDGDSMYWAIYEDIYHDGHRSILYMDKQTFDSLEKAVYIFNKVDLDLRDSINTHHGFIIVRDSEGLHLCSTR